jgi:hypothetical protein
MEKGGRKERPLDGNRRGKTVANRNRRPLTMEARGLRVSLGPPSLCKVLLPGPPIFSSIPTSPLARTSTPSPTTLPLRGLPSSTVLSLRRVNFSLLSLTMLQLLGQVGCWKSQMHEVAKATAITFAILILTAASLAEVCDRREFCIKRAACRQGIYMSWVDQ